MTTGESTIKRRATLLSALAVVLAVVAVSAAPTATGAVERDRNPYRDAVAGQRGATSSAVAAGPSRAVGIAPNPKIGWGLTPNPRSWRLAPNPKVGWRHAPNPKVGWRLAPNPRIGWGRASTTNGLGSSVDVNRDGWHDFLLREQPHYPYANVGSNCDVWRYNTPWHARLYVRPPIVWGLPGRGRQRVAWRSRFYDVGSNEVVATGAWKYAGVERRQATTFGGGPQAGNGLMITHNQYWVAGQYYDHLADSGERIRALIDAGWYNARTRRWTIKTLRVLWVITTTNRTNGAGQTGPYSTPIKNGTC